MPRIKPFKQKFYEPSCRQSHTGNKKKSGRNLSAAASPHESEKDGTPAVLSAKSVKLAGDFTNWEKSPLEMTKAKNGVWRIGRFHWSAAVMPIASSWTANGATIRIVRAAFQIRSARRTARDKLHETGFFYFCVGGFFVRIDRLRISEWRAEQYRHRSFGGRRRRRGFRRGGSAAGMQGYEGALTRRRGRGCRWLDHNSTDHELPNAFA